MHFEASASEATAAAMLAASINYPLRGAVTWKSTVGTNVASDALANLASAGVKGGALIIVGEDYGEGASIMQERTHAFAMKSQIWLLDPRPHLPEIVRAVEQGFELSEASHTPVMLMLRIRACHVYGRFTAKDNMRPPFSAADALRSPSRDYGRIILPPSTYAQEREKIEQRFPAAVDFVAQRRLNDFCDGDASDVGIVLQGGLYNNVLRALELLDCADAFGTSRIPLYVLNVTYPLVPDEWVEFCAGKRAVLVVEEGQPEFIEQAASQILRQHEVPTALLGKGVLPMAWRIHGRLCCARASANSSGSGRRRFAASRPRPARHGGAAAAGRATGEARAAAPVGSLHRLSGAPVLRRHEAAAARDRAAAHQRRHRLPLLRDAAAFQHGQQHHGIRPRRRGRLRLPHRWRRAVRSRSWATEGSGTTDSPAASATPSSTGTTA